MPPIILHFDFYIFPLLTNDSNHQAVIELRLVAMLQIPSGIIKPLDYQLTSDYLAGSGRVGVGGGGGGTLLDFDPTGLPSYETSLLHDSLVAQRLANRKARLIPGVPTSYQATEYATRYGPPAVRHSGRRANHDFTAQSIDINS